MAITFPPIDQAERENCLSEKTALGLSCLEQGDGRFLPPDRCHTHSVSGLPDRHLARENIEVFPRLAVIPELEESKQDFCEINGILKKTSTIVISAAFKSLLSVL